MSTLATEIATEPAWLLEVRLRARRRTLWCRELWSRHRYIGEDAMAIGHGAVDIALVGQQQLFAAELEFQHGDAQAHALTAELELLAEHPAEDRWRSLCSTLELGEPAQALLALALAVELAPGLAGVYGYLHDETAPRDPTPVLAAELWGWGGLPRFDAHDALLRWALARPRDPAADPASSTTGWIADPLLLEYLLDDPTARPAPFGRLVAPRTAPQLHARELENIVAFAEALASARGRSAAVEIELLAPPGSGRTTLAANVAARLGQRLIAVDCRAVAASADPAAAVAREERQARLAGALLLWQDADALPAGARREEGGDWPLVFLGCEHPHRCPSSRSAVRRSYRLSPISRAERLQLWAAGPRGGTPPPEPVAQWALRPAEIRAVAAVADGGEQAVRDICRGLLHDVPQELLAPLPQPYEWEDFVAAPRLREHLHELEEQARERGEVLDDWGLARLTPLGRGVTALFSGPSGTGKTMAAQVLSRALGLELYRVDLAGVVNKYIGETEKHLRTLFDACERAPVMLFFDEADALFGKRTQVSDAHDRFANIEIDYLLQRMEQFDGIAVLATNRKGDLDSAFMRRLRFTIDFAPPTAAERERLWRAALEDSSDRAGRALVGPVDWSGLARELNLTGAGIKTAALAAAFLARSERMPIDTRHLLAAARRELDKQGVVVRTSQLEAA